MRASEGLQMLRGGQDKLYSGAVHPITLLGGLLGFLVTISACGPAPPIQQPNQQPNVLFLFADDQRADTIHAWGNPDIETPNLDQLVAEGFSFRSNYNLGGNSGAVCVPSRAMVNSGLAYFRVSNDLSGTKTMPEQLRDHGLHDVCDGQVAQRARVVASRIREREERFLRWYVRPHSSAVVRFVC